MEKAVDPGAATDEYTTHFVLDSELPSLQTWFDAFSAGWEYDFINQSWYEVILVDPPIDGDELEQRVRLTQATTPVIDSFCEECSSMFARWPSSEDEMDDKTRTAIWNASSTHIEAAARNGCKLCSMLRTLLSRAEKLDPMRRIERRLEALEKETASHLVVDSHRQDSEWTLKLMLPAVPEDAQALLEGINVNRILDTHEHNLSLVAHGQVSLEILREDQDWVSTAQAWLEHCSEFHRCTRSASVDRPSRLLDITDGRIKLIYTSTMEQAPRYATLSYCWGLQPFFMLTRSNLVRLQQDILYEDLPNLFREFVILARSLDIPHIWIDALCIIQHDPEDWLKESSLMAVIYGNAHVNISASSAPSVRGSLYCMQPLHRTGFTKVLSTPTKTYKICVSEAEAVSRAVVETHLATRAWTHQERLLAPRTLYYGEQGLFWQCDRMCASNFLPERHPGLPASSSRTQRDGLFEWRALVERYSAAQLTHNSDRIVALAGVARRQHELSVDRYIAGMWERDFLDQLWWSGGHVRPAWRAPTWSWLSVEGPIKFSTVVRETQKELKGLFVQLVRVSTTPSGSDSFGNIKSAELRLACDVLLRMCCNDEVVESSARFRKLECRTLSKALRVDLDAADCGIGKGTELFLMPVIGMRRFIGVQKTQAPTKWLSIQGIALRACVGRVGLHERVGTFWLVGDRATQDFLAAADAEAAAVVAVSCAETLPSNALITEDATTTFSVNDRQVSISSL